MIFLSKFYQSFRKDDLSEKSWSLYNIKTFLLRIKDEKKN